jgi:hypothetical protein
MCRYVHAGKRRLCARCERRRLWSALPPQPHPSLKSKRSPLGLLTVCDLWFTVIREASKTSNSRGVPMRLCPVFLPVVVLGVMLETAHAAPATIEGSWSGSGIARYQGRVATGLCVA